MFFICIVVYTYIINMDAQTGPALVLPPLPPPGTEPALYILKKFIFELIFCLK